VELKNEGGKMQLKLLQVGIVVKDLDKTLQYMKECFGIVPFQSGVWPPENRNDMRRYYYGKPSDFTAKIAFVDMGNIELEIIQPLSGCNIYSDFIEKRGEGLHHIRFNVPDSDEFEKHMLKNGIKASQWGTGLRPGTQWMYFDSEDALGFIVESINTLQNTDGKTPRLNKGEDHIESDG
jgi:methylmalonyl-CoA/ethylmalonyl-CoA epimerase